MNPIRGEGRRRYANEVCVRAGRVDGESNPARRDERQETMTERTYACRDSEADQKKWGDCRYFLPSVLQPP